jgi:molybdenum cofactor guanylyltransferase
MDLSIIVLAGGHSTRMGRDKAQLEINGEPLLKRITDLGLSVSRPVIVVTSWPDRYRDIVDSRCQFVVDRFTDGPLVGFAEGLSAVETAWVLLLSCDLPNLDQTTVETWIQSLDTVPSAAIAYLPQGEKGWEPLCGFYRQRCGESLPTFIAGGGRSFQQWLQSQVVEVLPVCDRRVLFNWNRPEELELVIHDHNSL